MFADCLHFPPEGVMQKDKLQLSIILNTGARHGQQLCILQGQIVKLIYLHIINSCNSCTLQSCTFLLITALFRVVNIHAVLHYTSFMVSFWFAWNVQQEDVRNIFLLCRSQFPFLLENLFRRTISYEFNTIPFKKVEGDSISKRASLYFHQASSLNVKVSSFFWNFSTQCLNLNFLFMLCLLFICIHDMARYLICSTV